MNFTESLSQFQGALVSADNVHNFSELSAKGGNEDKITNVIEIISKFLEQSGYIKNGEINQYAMNTMRKYAFYIILNAELLVLNEMVELEGIDSVVWTITTVPQCLMCELMWNIHMDRFIHEIISYTHPDLALEVAGAFLDNFKYADPVKSIDRLQLLSTACYNIITRLYLLSPTDCIPSIFSVTAFNKFQQCLKYFQSPPNEYKLNALSKDELYEYQGKRFLAMLLLIDHCIDSFTSKIEINVPGSDIYMLTYNEGSLELNITIANVCDIQNNVIRDCLYNSHTEMLDTCKAMLMDISLDVFCRWSEVEDSGKTMQQTIGELCYKVRNKLLSVSSTSEHSVVSMMKEIARKPDAMQDIINITADDVILQKISSSTDRKIWIQSLVHKENVCQSLEFLNIISSNLDLFDQNQCHKLFTIINEYAKLDTSNQSNLELLLVKVFHECSVPTKYMILDQNFKNNNFVNMRTSMVHEFENAITETFNKLIATPNSDCTGVLTLFLQNPKVIFSKIFSLATENMQQAEVMINVMKVLEKYSNYYYDTETEPCVIKITQEVIQKQLDTTAKENNYIKFICGLKDADIIPGSKLLLLVIMTNMHQGLITKDIKSINFHVKLLKEVYRLDELLAYRAPTLAMLGKVLDVVRWRMNTFSASSPTTLNATLELQKLLFNTYNDVVPDKERNWLKSKVGNLQPLNMYYYRGLWHPPGANYLQVISGQEKDMTKSELSSWMSQVLTSCTQQEWCHIWDSSGLEDAVKLDSFVDAIGLLSLAEASHRTESTIACLVYCYRNFVYLVRYKYFKEPLTDSQVINAINQTAIVVDLIKGELEELTSLILPLFAYLSEKQADYTINYSEYMNENMKNAPLTKQVNKMFSNGNA